MHLLSGLGVCAQDMILNDELNKGDFCVQLQIRHMQTPWYGIWCGPYGMVYGIWYIYSMSLQ